MLVFLSGEAAEEISAVNSLMAQVPLMDRPGPPAGRLGSVINSKPERGEGFEPGMGREDFREFGRGIPCARTEPSFCG